MTHPGACSERVADKQPAARRSGWATLLIVLLVLALGVSVLLNMGLLMLLGAGGGMLHERDRAPFAEMTVAGERGSTDKIALIELRGVILDEVKRGGGLLPIVERPVERLRRAFEQAQRDEAVRAVVLRIESPGGAVGTSDRLWRLVHTFRERSGKPVVVSMGSVCASGGYYVACAADRLIAEPTTITGSIGVILRGFNVSKLLSRRLDVQPVTIKSGDNKDLLNPFEPLEPAHLEIVQATIDQAYDRFVGIVARGRKRAGLDESQVRALADGRIYTARDALERRLIDAIGYLEDAFSAAKELAHLERAKLVRYRPRRGLLDLLQAAATTPAPSALSLETLLEISRPRLLALWWGR